MKYLVLFTVLVQVLYSLMWFYTYREHLRSFFGAAMLLIFVDALLITLLTLLWGL